jgi:hypothetical protein
MKGGYVSAGQGERCFSRGGPDRELEFITLIVTIRLEYEFRREYEFRHEFGARILEVMESVRSRAIRNGAEREPSKKVGAQRRHREDREV